MQTKIGFVGLSHLGVVSSIATAAKGFTVIGYDADAAVCESLSAGTPTVHEPGLTELLAECGGRMEFTTSSARLAACDVVVFSKDIPTSDDNDSDTAALDALVDSVLPSLSPASTLVVLSQVRPGYTRRLLDRIRLRQGCQRTEVIYQVETLVFGRAVERATEPERYIVGCDDPRRPLPPAYSELLAAFGCPILPMRYESAELCKTAINLFLVASVSTTNTLAGICEGIGADWSDIVPALRLDKRIGPHAYLSPGLGLSGGNLERDLVTLKSLAAESGTDSTVISAYVENSNYRRDWTLRTLHRELPPRKDRRTVAVWGLAYKPNTGSTKNSPSLALIESLGGHHVRIYDPQARFSAAPPAHVTVCKSPLEACDDADALIVMTPWNEFAAIDPAAVAARLRGRIVLDPLAGLDAAGCAAAGLAHHALGVTGRQIRAA